MRVIIPLKANVTFGDAVWSEPRRSKPTDVFEISKLGNIVDAEGSDERQELGRRFESTCFQNLMLKITLALEGVCLTGAFPGVSIIHNIFSVLFIVIQLPEKFQEP